MTETEPMDDETREGYEKARERLTEGDPILFDNGASDEHDLPGINDPEGAQHLGMGMFTVERDGGKYTFRGGGAMYHYGSLSWTSVTGDIDFFTEDTGYDIDAVIETVDNVLDA